MGEDSASAQDHSSSLAYDLHGLRIAFESDALLATALRERLGQLPPAPLGPADLTFTFRSTPTPAEHVVDLPPPGARLVYASDLGEFRYDETSGALFIVCGDRVRTRCDAARGWVQTSIVGMKAADLWLLSHPLVTIPLLEMAKHRGLFSLHASAVAIDGACLIFPGASGSGKSTLALALARGGWDLLGDDMLFLTPGRDGPLVRAFPEPIDITDQTITLFAELGDLGAVPKQPGWPKRQLPLPERYGTRIAWACRPAALIFPRVAHRACSALSPMDRDEALLELVPNVFLTEDRATQAHLDALASLVGQCACYRLETGSDLDALPSLLQPLLA
ncbi:MAG TPA: hypothetical protein VNL71_13095 [Chloroflexota bacterium]|nr:hypothetical protein [Chloroflexota bacterium]